MKRFCLLSFLFVLSGIFLSPVADATTVQNDISVRSSTGGNSINGAQNQGKSEASVYSKTTVDGEVVSRVDETKTTETGEPVEVKIEKHVQVEDKQDNEERKPLIVSVVEFFKNLFSRFFA